jgi:adenylyltransferase/sulfurtransferase
MEVVDLLENTNVHMNIQRNAANFSRTALETNYKAMSTQDETFETRITAKDLEKRLKSPNDIVLLDVRELFEIEICSFDGALIIPMQQIPSRMQEISKTKPIVAICHHGIRSAHAINFLRENGWSNLTNLEGGIHAWAKEVDPDMTTY